jgi:hypothetical protein
MIKDAFDCKTAPEGKDFGHPLFTASNQWSMRKTANSHRVDYFILSREDSEVIAVATTSYHGDNQAGRQGPSANRARGPRPLHRRQRLRRPEDDAGHLMVLDERFPGPEPYLRTAADVLLGQSVLFTAAAQMDSIRSRFDLISF